jgi:hypothetical protein
LEDSSEESGTVEGMRREWRADSEMDLLHEFSGGER